MLPCSHFRMLKTCFVLFLVVAPTMSQAYSQDEGAPPWGSFLRQGRWPGFDRLLRRPFRMSPVEDPKGLAAKLRARELDVPNRQKAVRYLKTFHCAKFPEARDMLLDVMLNDKWEPVRYEAAMGLRDMFANCACGTQEEKSKRELERERLRGAPDPGSPKHCACCCTAEVLQQISRVAYEIKSDGCCFEPSRRVRQMAVEAIKACGVKCSCAPYRATEEMGPPAFDAIDQGGSGGGSGGGETVPPMEREGDGIGVPQLLPSFTTARPMDRLNRICLVSYKRGKSVSADPGYTANYRGRVYRFHGDAERQEFLRSPERYAVQFGGCDPVHFVETREVAEGRFLVTHEDRFYMFASKTNYDKFLANPSKYTLSDDR